VVLSVIAGLAVSSSAWAEPSNKWRIEFNEAAQSDGSIIFSVIRPGTVPVQVVTNVPGGLTENNIAELVSKSFKTTLNAGYHIETDDGEHVLVKKDDDAPDFEIRLVSSTVPGVQIDLQRE
jgi:hypothetical protein